MNQNVGTKHDFVLTCIIIHETLTSIFGTELIAEKTTKVTVDTNIYKGAIQREK